MLNKFKKQMKNEKGLTLIELLAVIVIIAIIAAIAIPAIGNIITNSKYNAVKADGLNVLNAAQMYYLDDATGTDDVTVQDLLDENYLEDSGSISPDAEVSRATPLALSATASFGSGKTVTFEDATITAINADTQKGSSSNTITISTPTTPGP